MTQRRQWLLFGAILGIGALSAWTLVRWGGLTTPSSKAPPGAIAVKPQPAAPKPAPQAVLPFNNGQGGGGAAVPNFGNGNAGGAAVPFNNNQNRAAGVPNFGNVPQGNGGSVPFAPNNQVASATPFNGTTAGGAGVPSFGTVAGELAPNPSGPTQGGALLPMLIQDPIDPNATAKHYLKQICGERVPTLDDWQKLAQMKLPKPSTPTSSRAHPQKSNFLSLREADVRCLSRTAVPAEIHLRKQNRADNSGEWKWQ